MITLGMPRRDPTSSLVSFWVGKHLCYSLSVEVLGNKTATLPQIRIGGKRPASDPS